MNNLTAQEIIAKLKTERTNGWFPSYEIPKAPELGSSKEVYQQGGENRGSNWQRVLHFEDHDIYIMIKGWYSSYEGAEIDLDDCIEVFPKEKTITVYE